jgi:serine protease
LNFVPAKYATANATTVKLGTGGQLCVSGLQGTNLILDAVGYLPNVASSPVHLLSQPARLVDSRAGSGYAGAGQALRGYTTPNCYTVAGVSGIPSDAVGIMLNLTTTANLADGWLTVYPLGVNIPSTSNLNFAPFETAIANGATVRIGNNGQVCAIGLTGVQVIVDAVGYLMP